MTLLSFKRHIDRKFATKMDLRRFATKKDLRRFAIKSDLRRFATKDDLAALEARLEARMDTGFGRIMRQFESLNSKFDAALKPVHQRMDGQTAVLDEHESRLQDLERLARR